MRSILAFLKPFQDALAMQFCEACVQADETIGKEEL
jgi:hypothetical protein